MNEGDVALTVLPQADGQRKSRPVVALRRMPPFDDWLVCRPLFGLVFWRSFLKPSCLAPSAPSPPGATDACWTA